MLSVSDLGIVADDLTGACDVAAAFSSVVGPVLVRVSPEGAWGSSRGLEVINTQSRLLSPDQGRAVMRQVGVRLAGKRVIFVKIDAALRGAVGAELEGLVKGTGPRRVVVAPAIPSIGRTTRGGIQYDGGVSIDQTAYANDPISPVRLANVAELLSETGSVACQICDAETDDDMCRIVDQALKNPEVVLVGSLGLADALADRIDGVFKRKAGTYTVRCARRPLIVCGSKYQRAQGQIQRAIELRRGHVVNIPAGYQAGTELLEKGDNMPLIVRLSSHPVAASDCPPEEILSRFIKTVERLIDQLEPDGLGIIGGETSLHLLSRLQVGRIMVYGRIAEVAAYGLMKDGLMSSCPLTTKGGSVGPENAVIQMLDYLLCARGAD